MKTKSNKIDFTKSSLVELNDKQIEEVKGGSFSTAVCLLKMSSIIRPF